MSLLNKAFNSEKSLINIYSTLLFTFGGLFGVIYYFYGNEVIVNSCQNIFFYQDNSVTNDYNIYLIITSTYIFLSLLISTSFLGVIFNSFVIFSKGMQLIIGSVFYFTLNSFNLSMLFFVFLPQLFIELTLTYVISIISIKLSINCFTISFLTSEVFNSHKIINYILDYVIIILIIVTLSMAFKVYVL